MNILFIDNINTCNNIKLKWLYNFLGFYIIEMKNKKIFYLSINLKKINNRLYSNILKQFLKIKFKNKKVYVVLSKFIDENIKIKEIITNGINNLIFVSNQNNLYDNDKIYIEKYIKDNNLDILNIKIIVIIDELDYLIKRKIENLILKYKFVDVFSTCINNEIINFIEKMNNNYGTVIEILDKIPFEYYNIFLVFSKKYKVIQTKSSFILDYNNSDLDVKSNTYLIFKNNIKYFNKIFKYFDIEISRFEKTKLGKLYIHASRLILDI